MDIFINNFYFHFAVEIFKLFFQINVAPKRIKLQRWGCAQMKAYENLFPKIYHEVFFGNGKRA